MRFLTFLLIFIWGCAETEKKTVSYPKKSATVSKRSDSNLNASADAEMEIGNYCSRGDFKKAFSIADENYFSLKNKSGYWNQIGNCYYLMKDFKKAILFYNKAKGINPNNVPAVNNVGVVFQAQGDFKQALYFYKNAVNLAAGSKTARLNMANLYLKFGNTNKACGIINALAQTDSDIINARANCFLFNRNYSAAVSEFKKIPNEDLSKAYIGLNYSVALGLLGRKGEALDNYKNISQKNIGNLRNYYRNVGDYLNRI